MNSSKEEEIEESVQQVKTIEEPKTLEEPVEQEEELTEPTINEEETSQSIEEAEPEPIIEEEPIPIDDLPEDKDDDLIETEDEDNDFIFSQFERREKAKESDEDKDEITTNKTTAEPNMIKEQTNKPTESTNKFEEALKLVNKQVILSEGAIFDALKKKSKEILGVEPKTFEEAINELKKTVRIPFIDEIKKVHETKKKIDKGESIDIEEATMTMRTTKNFLGIFE